MLFYYYVGEGLAPPLHLLFLGAEMGLSIPYSKRATGGACAVPAFLRRDGLAPPDSKSEIRFYLFRSFIARSISRPAARFAMSSRLSWSFLPLQSPTCTFTFESLKYIDTGTSV